jgi:hypothetical protein
MKKISLTFLFTTAFAILAMFSTCGILLAQTAILTDPGEFQDVVAFIDPAGDTHVAIIKVTQNPYKVEVSIDNNPIDISKIQIPFTDFMFCTKVAKGTTNAIEIPCNSDKYYTCSELQLGRDRSFLLGNHIQCPYFLKDLGMLIDLCPGHTH